MTFLIGQYTLEADIHLRLQEQLKRLVNRVMSKSDSYCFSQDLQNHRALNKLIETSSERHRH